MSFPARWFGGSPTATFYIDSEGIFWLSLLAFGALVALAILSFLSRRPWSWVCDRMKLHPQHAVRRRIFLFGTLAGLSVGLSISLILLARMPHGDPPPSAPPGSWAAGYPTGGIESLPLIRETLGSFEVKQPRQMGNRNGFRGDWHTDFYLVGDKQPGALSVDWERSGWFAPWKIQRATLTIWVPWEYEPGKTTPVDRNIDLLTGKPVQERRAVIRNGTLVPVPGP